MFDGAVGARCQVFAGAKPVIASPRRSHPNKVISRGYSRFSRWGVEKSTPQSGAREAAVGGCVVMTSGSAFLARQADRWYPLPWQGWCGAVMTLRSSGTGSSPMPGQACRAHHISATPATLPLAR